MTAQVAAEVTRLKKRRAHRRRRNADEAVELAPAPPKLLPTFLGALIATEAAILGSTLLWQVRPLGAVLGLALGAALAANAWFAVRALRRAQAQWLLPDRPHAGDEALVGAVLSAATGSPPLRLEAVDPASGEREAVAKLAGLAGSPVRVSWTVRFPHRGLATLPPLVVTTNQPFGLATAAREVSAAANLLVLPAIGILRRQLRNRLNEWLEQTATGADPGDDEISHLRPYRPGDARHSIHWRASARARALLVAERNNPACKHLAIVLDTNQRAASGRRFERLVSVAATLLDYLAARGWALSLYGAFAPSGIHGNRNQMLEALAMVQPAGEHSLADFVPDGRAALVLAGQEIALPPLRPRPLLLTLAECEELVRLPRRMR